MGDKVLILVSLAIGIGLTYWGIKIRLDEGDFEDNWFILATGLLFFNYWGCFIYKTLAFNETSMP